MPVERLPIVGVMGSGEEPHEDLAAPVGIAIAEADCHLLTGGGRGVMEAVSHAFCSVKSRKGRCIGVLRAEHSMNPFVEIPICTHLPLSGTEGKSPLSRNHINVLTADILIALPGSAGTLSEVGLRLEYGRDLALYLGNNTIAGQNAEALRDASAHPERIHVLHDINDVRRYITESTN